MRDIFEELKQVQELLKIEQEEDRQQYKIKSLKSSIQERKDMGFCWYPVVISKEEIGFGNKVVIELERTSGRDQLHLFQTGKAAALFSNNGDRNTLNGVIVGLKRNKVLLATNKEDLPDWIDDGKLGIDLTFDEMSYREMEFAMKKVIETDKTRLAELRDILLGVKALTFTNLKVDGKSLVNNDHPQVVEIWNNVFMEFNRLADGSLVKLPAQHVDTGMGFERLCMAIQGKRSNYDTDVFQPLIQFVAKEAGVVYGENEKTDIAIRVISDHIRAIAFTIADGQLPSNNKAGYVIRRILRRAVRYGFTFLDFKKPSLYKLAGVLADQMETVFPELKQQLSFVQRVIEEEENAFLRTLENGLKRLDALEAKFKENNNTIDGKTAFELYDTFGFPLDLTALIAREKGLTVDEAGFGVEMEQQKNRSRNASASEQSDWVIVQPDVTTEFVGYDCNVSDSHIVRYRQVKTKNKSEYHIVLDKTPFYAESGGQVGDIGYLISDAEQIEVLDTKKENDLILHITSKLPQTIDAAFRSEIDFERRNYIRKNHSATHLLHAALRKVLGEHVQQKGSLVNEKVLRFDFSHFAKVEDAQIREIEHIVNERVRQSIPLEEQRNVPIAKAKEIGATALFGEKYGEYVRVIAFDREHSVELCGGTHVYNTGGLVTLK